MVDSALVSGSWGLRRQMTKQLPEVPRESASIEETALQGGSFHTHLSGTGCDESLTCYVEPAKFQISHRGNTVGLLESDLQRSCTDTKLFAQLVELNRLLSRRFENVPNSGQETISCVKLIMLRRSQR